MNGMNHPLQQMIARQMMGQTSDYGNMQMPAAPMVSGIPRFANPMQKVGYILQAMRNPAQFVRQHVNGIPESAFNDPTGNSVLNYMQQNMGVTQQDIMNAQNQISQYQQMQNPY